MRTIKKTIKVQEIQCTIYDRVNKKESVATYIVPETHSLPETPDNCVLLESKVLSEKEVIYVMSPETFIEHATIVADEPKAE
jgi:hypothetical protein